MAKARQTRLLPDIWQEIFPYLPRDNIPNVTLTCQSFCQIAQSLIFHDLVFRPYIIETFRYETPRNDLRRCALDTQARLRFIKRLNFCSSHDIAHGVQSIYIRPQETLELGNDPGDTSDLLLHALLRQLPSFVNLKKINCEHIWWTIPLWKDFCARGQLQELTSINCTLEIHGTGSATLPRTQVQRVNVVSLSEVFSTEEWNSMLDTEGVGFSVTADPDSGLSNLSRRTYTVTHLRSLATIVYPETVHALAEVFIQKPPIRILQVITMGVDPPLIETLPYMPLPLLMTYHGPFQLLCKLHNDGTLRHLKQLVLQPMSIYASEASVLSDALREVALWAPDLEFLDFKGLNASEELLLVLCSLKSLKHISMSFVKVELSSSPNDYHKSQVR